MKCSTAFIVIFIQIAFAVASHDEICECPLEPVCGENEEIPACIPCIQTCNDIHRPSYACPRICRKTSLCYCKAGYVRGDDDTCIPESQCRSSPPPACSCPAEPACGPNEEIPGCVPCVQTCSDVLQPKACAAVCQPTTSCYCKSGFVRGNNGTCIPEQQCRQSPGSQCGVNQQIANCVPCPATCADKESHVCAASCGFPGRCYCKPGYLENANGTCIPASDCPITTPPIRCGTNETIAACVPCQQTCEDVVRGKTCATDACQKADRCFCSEGFVRGGNGKCIPKTCCFTKRDCS